MARLGLLLVVAASLSGFRSLPNTPQERPGLGGYADHDSAYVWGHQSGFRSKEVSNSSSTRRRLVRIYVPACQGNLPSARRNLGAVCGQAAQVCDSTPDPDDIGYWVYTAPAGPPAPRLSDFTSQGQVVCRGGGRPGETPEPVVTVADFRRLPLPAAGLRVQPPTLRTLVNVRTNLYAESAPTILPTTILGFPIRVRATPRSFRWTYGDGTARDTSQAGGPYPMLDTAHIYTRPGHPTVALSTAYSGEYSVDGGPWQPIDGTARVSSPTVSLTVVEARTHLVAGP